MKILHVDINNIRSYKDLSVDLSENLTVLRGESDSGKSAFIKSLLFAIRNFSPKNTVTKKSTGPSFVSLSDGFTIVRREKDGTSNYYSVNSDKEDLKEYTALGKEVPFEVKKALNLSDVNIQQQKETYFLIDKSNGIISKKLNEVSGLSEIDRTLKAITTVINTITSDIREKNNRIAEEKEKIKDSEWTVKADVELKLVEKLDVQIDVLDSEVETLKNSLTRHLEISIKINNLLPTSIIDEYKTIVNLEEDTDSTIADIRSIQNLINSYLKTKSDHDNSIVIDPSIVSDIQAEIDVLNADIMTTSAYIKAFTQHTNLISVADERLTKTEKELKLIKVCPTCKRPL